MMEEFYAEAGTPFHAKRAAAAFGELLRDGGMGNAWILEIDGAPAGYVVVTYGFSLEFGGRDAFVDDLFVRRGHRRLGLGRMAVEKAFEECRRRGVRTLLLEVARANDPARELYRLFGFADRAFRLMAAPVRTDDSDV
jgi:ribosomal protein S18 acetylase RimI-like enzyme